MCRCTPKIAVTYCNKKSMQLFFYLNMLNCLLKENITYGFVELNKSYIILSNISDNQVNTMQKKVNIYSIFVTKLSSE